MCSGVKVGEGKIFKLVFFLAGGGRQGQKEDLIRWDHLGCASVGGVMMEKIFWDGICSVGWRF